eukprot:6292071-Prymnesium_polylepis.1
MDESTVPLPRESRVAVLPCEWTVIVSHVPLLSTSTFSIVTSTPSYASPAALHAVPSWPEVTTAAPTLFPPERISKCVTFVSVVMPSTSATVAVTLRASPTWTAAISEWPTPVCTAMPLHLAATA